jgi:SEFIR domain
MTEPIPQDVGGTVFISYSHDSSDHVRAVLTLSNKLRSEGVDCVLDQYEACPPEGWPHWMDREINKAQFVLMICTEAYYRRVMGEEKPGVGLGIAWEGSLIYNHIYVSGSLNTKFIPVIFDQEHAKYIPTPIQGATRYCVSANHGHGYQQLYSRLIGKPLTEKPALGKLKALSQREVKTIFFDASHVRERQVDALMKVVRHFRDALGYLQSMVRAYRFGVEVSVDEYCRLFDTAVASARETFAESRLLLNSPTGSSLLWLRDRLITAMRSNPISLMVISARGFGIKPGKSRMTRLQSS